MLTIMIEDSKPRCFALRYVPRYNSATMNAIPKFSEMQKVRTCVPDYGSQLEGFVIANKFHEGRWIYKISLPKPDEKDSTYDNWMAEEQLEIAR